MQLLVNVLCYLFGVATALASVVYWVRYVDLKERAEAAEKANRDMEGVLNSLDEQQRLAAEALQNSLTALSQRHSSEAKTLVEQHVKSEGASVKERLRRAVELTSLQNQIDRNKGPEFIMQHNELELEKLTVLKSIIADGFDPVITIRFNTGDESMLLSSYIQSINKGLA